MMESRDKKERQRHFDRVTLDSKTLDRLDSWISQVKASRLGVDLSRKDLLNWLIVNLPEALSQSHEKALAEKFYNEVRYLRYAAQEISRANARGETLTLKDLEGRERTVGTKEPKMKRTRKLKLDSDLIASENKNTIEVDSTITTTKPTA
jgi:hypothetical protein